MAWTTWTYDGRKVKNGRAWRDDDGRLHYYGRKAGVDVSLGTEERVAFEELRRFREDPTGYRTKREAARATAEAAEPIRLDDILSREFLKWSLAPEAQGGRGNTKQWVGKQKAALTWWAERFGNVDLRRATLRDHILPQLKGTPGRAHKIRVLKALFSWLRKVEHRISSAEDPCIDLMTPQSEPAQWKRSKAVPREHFELVREVLQAKEEERRQAKVVPIQAGAEEDERHGPWLDLLTLQGATGWHTTEACRFAAKGSTEPLPRGAKKKTGAVGVVVCPLTKGGEMLRTAVGPEALEAAERVLKHGPVSREWYDRAVRAACVKAKLKTPFSPGMLRHSVATWAVNKGADPAQVSAFLGHKSARTTRRFYATLAVPPKVPTLI